MTGLLDINTVAERLGCSPRHIRRLVNSGDMPAPIKLGKLSRWDSESIDAWIAGGCLPAHCNTTNNRDSNRKGNLK